MLDFVKRTWAEIDLDAIKYNFESIRSRVSEASKIMCVVKADAYGHGARYIAKELQDVGADWFAVSNIEEAMELRNYGIKKPILILGYTPVSMVGDLDKYDISQAVLSMDYAQRIIFECKSKGIKIKVHIKLDTGMNRIGFSTKSENEIIDTVKNIRKIKDDNTLLIEGIFTHFSVADDPENGYIYTKEQFSSFTRVIDALEKEGIRISLKHCSNSGAIIDYPEMNLDMVRAGIILYGLCPSEKLKGKMDIRPAMQLKTVVSQLKEIPPNASISYGRTFTSTNRMNVATVPIGYADGYIRSFSNRANMIVCGEKVPVIGRVCMDQLMLDVTGVSNVREDSVVTVFGSEGNSDISVDELAEISGTINYEIVCLIGRRVSRVYYKGGKNSGKLNYMLY